MKHYYGVFAITEDGDVITHGTYPSYEEANDAAYAAVDMYELQGVYATVNVIKARTGAVDLQLHAIEPPH